MVEASFALIKSVHLPVLDSPDITLPKVRSVLNENLCRLTMLQNDVDDTHHPKKEGRHQDMEEYRFSHCFFLSISPTRRVT